MGACVGGGNRRTGSYKPESGFGSSGLRGLSGKWKSPAVGEPLWRVYSESHDSRPGGSHEGKESFFSPPEGFWEKKKSFLPFVAERGPPPPVDRPGPCPMGAPPEWAAVGGKLEERPRAGGHVDRTYSLPDGGWDEEGSLGGDSAATAGRDGAWLPSGGDGEGGGGVAL